MTSKTVDRITIESQPRSLIQRAIKRFFCVVRAALWRQRFAEFGQGSCIMHSAFITGGSSIYIGDHVQIWPFARIEAINEHEGCERIRIHDSTVIQPHVHIAAAQSVIIGKDVLIASHVYITDHDHDFSNPDDPVIRNGRLLTSPVNIKDCVWLGERVIVLKGVTIGTSSIVGAGSVVTVDIPDYCIAAGVPARVIRSFDRGRQQWISAADARASS